MIFLYVTNQIIQIVQHFETKLAFEFLIDILMFLIDMTFQMFPFCELTVAKRTQIVFDSVMNRSFVFDQRSISRRRISTLVTDIRLEIVMNRFDMIDQNRWFESVKVTLVTLESSFQIVFGFGMITDGFFGFAIEIAMLAKVSVFDFGVIQDIESVKRLEIAMVTFPFSHV